MVTQKCPRCNSKRIRSGYRPTSIFKKITFRYNLLCDSCNWEFVGFAIPGTVKAKSKRRKQNEFLKTSKSENKSDKIETEDEDILLLDNPTVKPNITGK